MVDDEENVYHENMDCFEDSFNANCYPQSTAVRLLASDDIGFEKENDNQTKKRKVVELKFGGKVPKEKSKSKLPTNFYFKWCSCKI